MPIAAIGIGLGTAIAGAAAGGATIYGAHKQASAAKNAAQLQTDAANHAADVQAASSAEALAFQKQQAQQSWQQQEVDRRANYDQYAAREQRIGSISELLGYGGRPVPAYVPSVNPHLDQSGMPTVGQSAQPTQWQPPPRDPYAPGTIGAYLSGRR